MWKPIEGYEGLYEVSACGQVKSVDRVDSASRNLKGRLLRQQTNRDGYVSVTLCREGIPARLQVHRLVASAFIPNPCGLPMVNHCDFDRSNNRANNLEWVTRQENMDHAAEKFKRGESCHNAKLNPKLVREMRQARSDGFSVRFLASQYGVTESVAYKAIKRQTWRHVL